LIFGFVTMTQQVTKNLLIYDKIILKFWPSILV
jgi:hypothetical protein